MSSAKASDRRPSAGPGDLSARRAARLRIYELLRSVQDGLRMAEREITDLIDEAELRGWGEVVRLGLFLAIVCSQQEGGPARPGGLAELLDRARADGDVVMTALALAVRAQTVNASGDPASTIAADRDLAQASVMLEAAAGSSLEHASAHIECARAYGGRDLWELEQDHYAAAEAAVHTEAARDLVLGAILYNRAEVELNWCAALRELDATDELPHRSRLAREALVAADTPALPESWRKELGVFSTLLARIAADSSPPPPVDLPAEGPYAGYVHLARALSGSDQPALAEAERALALLDRAGSPQVHDLALCVAAEIEATLAGHETAGLRYAKHLAQRRWVARLSSLASMQSLLHAERLRSEHALLTQHAYLDDLTRLGNRRALTRFIEGLVSGGVSAVALVLVDLDDFKHVNDQHGHSVGDQTLIRVAAILRSAVRAEDVAVRLGGDEFLLLLALPNREAARRRSDALIAAIAHDDWDQIRPGLRLTASLGLAYGDPRRFEELSITADAALYRAKAAGGNQTSE